MENLIVFLPVHLYRGGGGGGSSGHTVLQHIDMSESIVSHTINATIGSGGSGGTGGINFNTQATPGLSGGETKVFFDSKLFLTAKGCTGGIGSQFFNFLYNGGGLPGKYGGVGRGRGRWFRLL